MTTLYIKSYGQFLYDTGNNTMAALLFYTMPNEYNSPPFSPLVVEFTGGTENPSATPYPVFNNVNNALDYYAAAQGAILLAQRNTAIGTSYYSTFDVEKIDSPVLGALDALAAVARSGAYADLSGRPTLAAVSATGAYSDLSGKPTIPAITAQMHITDAATNASTTQITTYNALTSLLGLTGGLNDANTAQNDLATKYNALATKFNTLLDRLEANNLLAAS